MLSIAKQRMRGAPVRKDNCNKWLLWPNGHMVIKRRKCTKAWSKYTTRISRGVLLSCHIKVRKRGCRRISNVRYTQKGLLRAV